VEENFSSRFGCMYWNNYYLQASDSDAGGPEPNKRGGNAHSGFGDHLQDNI
jgi:hypothetical protein